MGYGWKRIPINPSSFFFCFFCFLKECPPQKWVFALGFVLKKTILFLSFLKSSGNFVFVLFKIKFLFCSDPASQKKLAIKKKLIYCKHFFEGEIKNAVFALIICCFFYFVDVFFCLSIC